MAILNTTFIGGGGLKEGETFFFDYAYNITAFSGNPYGYYHADPTVALPERPICIINHSSIEYSGDVYRPTSTSGDFVKVGEISGNNISLVCDIGMLISGSSVVYLGFSLFGEIDGRYFPLFVRNALSVVMTSTYSDSGTKMNCQINQMSTTAISNIVLQQNGQGNVINFSHPTFYPLMVGGVAGVGDAVIYTKNPVNTYGLAATVTKDTSIKGIKITGIS